MRLAIRRWTGLLLAMIGFYPPGRAGAGQAMLNHLNSVVGHSTGR